MPKVRKTWIIVSIMMNVLRTVNVQFAMPMYQPPPPPPMVMMAPPPPPVHIPVGVPYPVPVPVIVTRKTTTTTTTTESPDNGGDGNFGVAIPFPLPFGFPMPFAVPQAPPPRSCTAKKRPKQCPPCPPCVCSPSCTPAFYSYCSPCHQKCRCKGKGGAPEPERPRPPMPVPLPMFPQPMPMPAYPMAPAPPPVFILPFPPAPPYRRLPRRISDDESDFSWNRSSSGSSDTSDSSSKNSDSDSDWRRRRRRFRTKKSLRSFRKNYRSMETDSDEGTIVKEGKLVKPMLSYISKQGEVKFQKRISKDDAADLMRDTDISKSAEVERRSANVVKDSRKVIFSQGNKLLSNLTVSFNVV